MIAYRWITLHWPSLLRPATLESGCHTAEMEEQQGIGMRQEFRAAARIGEIAVTNCLSQLRKSSRPENYSSCISAFKLYAPKQAQILFAGGPTSYGGVAFSRPILQHLTFENELKWAAVWLRGQSRKINAFREFGLGLQGHLLEGNVDQVVSALDGFMDAQGWCFWAVELRCALGHLAFGTEAQRQWISSLHRSAPNSVPGLLLHIFTDRNDETLSYDAFQAKCVGSLHRYRYVADWLPSYLIYRALVLYVDPEETYVAALARDVTSSLFDYYETVIDACKAICNDRSLRTHRPVALALVTALRADGFNDHRLEKLHVALTGTIERLPNREVATTEVDEIASFIFGRSDACRAAVRPPINAMLDLVNTCRENGVAASSSAANLSKFGLNLKGLDVGSALGMIPQDSSSDLVTMRVNSLESALLSSRFEVEDICGFPDDAGRAALKQLSIENPDETIRKECGSLVEIVEGQHIHLDIGASQPLTLWLGRQLIVSGRYEEARWLGEQLELRGSLWQRHGAKLVMWSLIRERRLSELLEYASVWIARNPEYVAELPFADMFDGNDWASFRELDPVLVGLVSHHVHAAISKSGVGYICKMSCRRFAIGGYRERVNEIYADASESYKQLLVAFLRDVWVEENLSMNHLLESTDDVRAERMAILQMLLPWDMDHEQDYITAIKDLTFDETLRQGLRHINQTRVFVNENGITRWVEKDLLPDFERWISLNQTDADLTLESGLARQYQVDPASEEFLMALGGGRPTEAHAQITAMIDRVFKRFLTDPADGLDCYLSLRIRHGSLRGTLFGPLEEQGLFYSTSGFSRTSFDERWGNIMDVDELEASKVFELLEGFTLRLRKVADELVNERIQIRSLEKPRGEIVQYVPPTFASFFTTILTFDKASPSLAMFAYACYYAFWRVVEQGLSSLADYVRREVKVSIQREFDEVVEALRAMGSATLPIVTTLTAVATTLQSQCDLIAEWFRLPGESLGEKFKLSAAIEIARAATKNVYRAFPAEVNVLQMPSEDPPVTTLALAGLSDALFVIFENAWKHSGLDSSVGALDLEASLDMQVGLLTLRVTNDISTKVRESLEGGLLQELEARYLASTPIELASREGGSGFAKLAMVCRYVSRDVCPQPLQFGLQGSRWYTSIAISLYERDGAYESLQ